ncbi:WGR domain-containing protein [Pseudomonas sp. PDM23]|uniref:WGR domain-containing protein n=1 Tax=unclassified Pseudomonas TaxID=196821 RepID=UPI00177BA9CF|nr:MULTISPECIES: WGR domain-containing protein [unclassified Pseudomonas]MBD9574141.1 WGR domain-containing protein [Pseudomonas sp. PDM23]MBD9671979.1 WGR domain-containing protein [Pseudomonas sp. PDM21]
MKASLKFTEEKADKFWRVETLGSELLVNYGKSGTSGRNQIKAFASSQDCEAQARKLTQGKVKKGYVDFSFDYDSHRYFDDEEVGLHRLTSHPRFVTHFADDVYYDCCDEDAPFGSDEGSDALSELAGFIRTQKTPSVADFPRWLIETQWGMTFIEPVSIDIEDALKPENKELEPDIYQSCHVVIATAFGQMKITGSMDASLKASAMAAIACLDRMGVHLGWGDGKPSVILAQLRKDLAAFVQ